MIAPGTVKKVLELLRVFAPIATLRFNLHYLPFPDAVKFPVFVYRHTRLVQQKGRLHIMSPIRSGMIKLGHYVRGTQDERYSDTTWEVNGDINFQGEACIGRGTKLSVGNNATLDVGERLTISGDTEVYCHHNIIIGAECTISWGCLVMDTDFHPLFDASTNILINDNKPITIGKHVWVGCRSVVLKGVSVADDTVIAAGSLISKPIQDKNCVVGGRGNGAKVILKNVRWEN